MAELLFFVLWAVGCLGLVALNINLIFLENRRAADLQGLSSFLDAGQPFDVEGAPSVLLGELAAAQKRATLPLAIDAHEALERLAQRLSELRQRLGENLVEEITGPPIGGDAPPPAISFGYFGKYPHSLVFAEARSFRSAPSYSFRLDYRQGRFDSEHFKDLRRGDFVMGWKVEGATSHKMRGLSVERQQQGRRGRVRSWSEKLPDFEIYRLVLSKHGKPAVVLTAPKTERDALHAKLSNFEFIDTLAGETAVAHVVIRGAGEREKTLEVKAGCEFRALGRKYRVRSVEQTALHLVDAQAGHELVWEVGQYYD